MKKRVLTAFYLLIFSFIILLCCVWFTHVKTMFSMVILVVLMVAWLMVYLPCINAITLPEGYNILQALIFYRKCVKRGIRSLSKIRKNRKLVKQFLKKLGITTVSDAEGLWKLYCDGQEIDFLIKIRR